MKAFNTSKLMSFFGGKKSEYKAPKDYLPIDSPSQSEYFESKVFLVYALDATQYMLTDFKKTLLELKLNGTINDPLMKCAGYIFQLKIGDD